MFSSSSLDEWLNYIDLVHPNTIELGLERTEHVRQNLQLKPKCPVISVTGTNGKGSVCSYLTNIYKESGFKTGTLTSPHLIRFNERIAINGEPVSDELIVAAFTAIEKARGDISLTYFEFNTLAAVWVFDQQNVDIMVLEVGLGGRLDAINVFDADCVVITNVGIDHIDYLGDTVEKIAYEKAGLFRANKYAVCGQIPAPQAVIDHAKELNTTLFSLEKDFSCQAKEEQASFDFSFNNKNRFCLPIPTLQGAYQLKNASCALAAIESLNDRLPVDIAAIKQGLIKAKNPGRFQVLSTKPFVILDVAHNPHAAQALVSNLSRMPFTKKRIAVFSMLADKDIDEVITICKDSFDVWYVSGLNSPRGTDTKTLIEKLTAHGIENILGFESIQEAYRQALSTTEENVRITVFGSFVTAAEILALQQSS